MIFALVGNQNCGKTTLFNALTGSNQHVGNFPGVTVDQKMGEMRDEKGCSVVDLPASTPCVRIRRRRSSRAILSSTRSRTASSTSWTPRTSSATCT